MNRRQALIGAIVGWFAAPVPFGRANAGKRHSPSDEYDSQSPASFWFLKEQIAGQWMLFPENLPRPWKPVDAILAQVSCGACTCPPGPEDEGFRASIVTAKNIYTILVKPDYLGCTMTLREPCAGEDWLRGHDLADGRRTIGTWLRIVRDICRDEGISTAHTKERWGF